MTDDPHDATWHEADPDPKGWRDNWPRVIPAAILAAVAVGVAFLAWPADAQEAPCAPREQIVSQLERKYGETRRGAGLTLADTLFEVWASDETGTWTVLTTRPDGTTCAIGAGHSWERDDAKPGRPM